VGTGGGDEKKKKPAWSSCRGKFWKKPGAREETKRDLTQLASRCHRVATFVHTIGETLQQKKILRGSARAEISKGRGTSKK